MQRDITQNTSVVAFVNSLDLDGFTKEDATVASTHQWDLRAITNEEDDSQTQVESELIRPSFDN